MTRDFERPMGRAISSALTLRSLHPALPSAQRANLSIALEHHSPDFTIVTQSKPPLPLLFLPTVEEHGKRHV